MFVCVCMSVCVYMCMYNMYVSVNGCIHVSMFYKCVYVFVILYLHACMISTVTCLIADIFYCDLLCYLSCINNSKTYGIKKCLHLYIYYTWYTLMLIIHTIHIRCSVSI